MVTNNLYKYCRRCCRLEGRCVLFVWMVSAVFISHWYGVEIYRDNVRVTFYYFFRNVIWEKRQEECAMFILNSVLFNIIIFSSTPSLQLTSCLYAMQSRHKDITYFTVWLVWGNSLFMTHTVSNRTTKTTKNVHLTSKREKNYFFSSSCCCWDICWFAYGKARKNIGKTLWILIFSFISFFIRFLNNVQRLEILNICAQTNGTCECV